MKNESLFTNHNLLKHNIRGDNMPIINVVLKKSAYYLEEEGEKIMENLF